MSLSNEQKQAVAEWVAAGDNLSTVQKKLQEQFQVSMTYMDVRFLVDDLELTLQDPAPKADASDVSKAPPAASAGAETATGEAAQGSEAATAADEIPEAEALPPDAAGAALANVSVTVDPVNLMPGALASGSVTFSDGVTGKWVIDNYGRPGFTEISQPGYQPSPADAQAFMQELSSSLQHL